VNGPWPRDREQHGTPHQHRSEDPERYAPVRATPGSHHRRPTGLAIPGMKVVAQRERRRRQPINRGTRRLTGDRLPRQRGVAVPEPGGINGNCVGGDSVGDKSLVRRIEVDRNQVLERSDPIAGERDDVGRFLPVGGHCAAIGRPVDFAPALVRHWFPPIDPNESSGPYCILAQMSYTQLVSIRRQP